MTCQTNFADFLEEYVQVVTEGDVVYLNASIYFSHYILFIPISIRLLDGAP